MHRKSIEAASHLQDTDTEHDENNPQETPKRETPSDVTMKDAPPNGASDTANNNVGESVNNRIDGLNNNCPTNITSSSHSLVASCSSSSLNLNTASYKNSPIRSLSNQSASSCGNSSPKISISSSLLPSQPNDQEMIHVTDSKANILRMDKQHKFNIDTALGYSTPQVIIHINA